MRATSLLFPVLLLALAAPAWGQGFSAASAESDARLAESLRELSRVRSDIAKEKIPLSTSVSRLESQVLELRRERGRLQKLRDSTTIDLSSLRKQVDSLDEQSKFIKSRLLEFIRDFEGRLDISELPRYETLTSAAKLADKNANLDDQGRLAAQLAVIDAALEFVLNCLVVQKRVTHEAERLHLLCNWQCPVRTTLEVLADSLSQISERGVGELVFSAVVRVREGDSGLLVTKPPQHFRPAEPVDDEPAQLLHFAAALVLLV